MTKYKEYFDRMLAENKNIFDSFKQTHDHFAQDRVKYQSEFNHQGEFVLEIIHDWEKRLCSRMEGGKNGVYSANLSEKFRAEIKKVFPMIDLVGVKLSFAA